MTRHDETQLWEYAARSLEADETKLLEHHLEECAVCSEKLEAVVIAREALLLARQSKPLMQWAGVDSVIEGVIDRRLKAKTARRVRWVPALVGLAMVAAAVSFIVSRPGAVTPVLEAPVAAVVAPVPSHVEHSTGLQVAGARAHDGSTVQSGDVLQTSAGADSKALIHLADASHLRVANATKLDVQTVAADEVSLGLLQGRIAIHASHEPRKDFVIHSGEVDVHVVGTVFSVSRTGPVTEVAVSEGRVRVETAGGDTVLVDPGQRVRFAGRNVQRAAVTPALQRELTEVQTEPEQAAAIRASPAEPVRGHLDQPGVVGGALPRLSAREAKARQVFAAPPAFPPAEPSAPAAATLPAVGTKLSAEPPAEILVQAPPTPAPKPAPEAEWAALPAAKPAVVATKPIAKDLESIFLQKAEASLAKGSCESFLLGLEEVASDAQTSDRTELARILRARCFDIGLRPKQAMIEYRKYLEVYPSGRFAAEAREAMGQ